jgi:hypothetical protein
MTGQNNRILGSFIVGAALVAGAYLFVNFGNPIAQKASVVETAAPVRVAVPVSDSDENGIEDWRDVFVTTKPVLLNTASSTYTPPTTMTGKLGIQFFEDVVRSKYYGPFGQDQAEVVTKTVTELARNTEQTLYDTQDVAILGEWNDETIKLYANAMGSSIKNNNKAGLDHEIVILEDILRNEKTDRLSELALIAESYKNMRDDALAIPVPQPLVKEHLDLINTYEAIYRDIEAMTQSLEDPVVTLLRIRRYEDDALGLRLAIENMYTALTPYAAQFSPNDNAQIFSLFGTLNKTRP